MATKSWKNVPSCASVELGYDDNGNLFDLHTDKNVEIDGLKAFVPADGCELVINFLSSGFSSPASMTGGPDHLGWPAEFEDERLLDNCSINGQELPSELAQLLFDHFENLVKDADVDLSE